MKLKRAISTVVSSFAAVIASAGSVVLICPPGGSITIVGVTPEPNTAPSWSITDRSIERTTSCALDLTTVSADAESNPLTYSLVSGALPTGCSLSGSSITGTATTNGAYAFVLGVNDGQNVVLRDILTSSTPLAWSSAASFTPAQTGIFSFSFTAIPSASSVDHVCGFGTQTPTGYAHLLYAVRFRSTGIIDARNNNEYAAVNSFPYTAATSYNVTGTINIPAKRYDISVNGTVIADDYLPRADTTVADLDYFTCVDATTPGTTGTTTGPLYLVQPVNASVTWTVFAETDTTPPSAPAEPTVTGVTQTTVTLGLPTPESFLRIYRSPAGCGSYALIQDNWTSTTFTDTGLTQNTGYCYRLVDVDAAGNASTPGTGTTTTTAAVDVNALLSIANVAVAEGNSGTANMTFVLTASASQAFNIVCNYATQAGSADSSTDYTSGSGTVQIDSGTTTENIVVVVNGDTTVETDETVGMLISNCGQGGTATNATTFTATGTITNDDVPSGSGDLTIAPASTAEGAYGVVTYLAFTVTLDGPVGSDTTFEYYTVDGTARAWVDFIGVSGVGIIRAGDTTFTIRVPIIGNATVEGTKTFTVRIANQGVVP